MKKIIAVVFAALLSVMICTVSVSAATLKLNKTTVNVPVGYKTTLKVSGASEKVEWSVKNSKIASVKATGDASAKIVGKSSGTTYVYAKVNGKTLKCKVNVKKSFITPSDTELSLKKDESSSITVNAVGSHDLLYSNSDSSVCSVSFGKWNKNKLKLTVKGKNAGTSDITLYVKDYEKSTAVKLSVTVKDPSTDPTVLIEEVAEIVNKEREAVGKGSLKLDDDLNEMAAVRAEEIASVFSHTRPDGRDCFTVIDDFGKRYMAVGENIAMCTADAEEVMKMWMNSPGHRGNILSGYYGKIGVGVYISGRYAYFVQIFAA